ncbi:LysR substrate-binding domain-containing protein [Roseomonas sp. E05]|uniref:LysR substrate-binding domain-containing protein n=1 Tax=Roseomonas sp. E05 TaxID=3046310 RepID=UPI0024B91DC9|nr:LysR substrate-binding domain-containing protein [Roseomonas sp. E05]MDJ0389592.1 LysR substrate-binding domain-containing protein [Roseomonas sp. E05]
MLGLMHRRLPPLNALRAFEAAARLGGFAAAAGELGVTAGAISQQVQLLEARLGRALFERGPRSLRLTGEGRALLPVLSEALDNVEAGIACALFPPPRVALAVFVQTSFALGWMLPRLPRFQRAQPEVELHLSTGIDAPELRGGPDAVVLHGRGPWPELATHLLFPDRLVPVCTPSWLATHGPAEPRRLAEAALLVSDTAPEDWEEWFAHAGLRGLRPERPLRFGSSLLPPQAALHGLGVALADRSLVAAELAAGRLVNPLPGLPPMQRGTGWHLAHLPARGREPALRALRDWLLREAGAAGPEPPD